MLERNIHAVRVEDPGGEEPQQTRERLRDRFPRGATRRMTQLGLLIGSVLHDLELTPADSVVYATTYGENHALRDYLESFPSPSPTLFQTSIHPSAVQQALIAQQRPVRALFPLAAKDSIVPQAVRTALGIAGRSILCGGEERGIWLRDYELSSPDTFAFALVLSPAAEGAIGRLEMPEAEAAGLAPSLLDFFHAIRDRRPLPPFLTWL